MVIATARWSTTHAPRWTDKRAILLGHYVTNGFNATAAARAVGHVFPNVAGPRLVNVGIIQQLDLFCQSVHMTGEQCAATMARIARTGIAEFLRMSDDGQGIVVDWQQVLHGGHRDLVQAIRVNPYGVEIRGMDRLRALKLLGGSLGRFGGRVVEQRSEQPVSQAVIEDALVKPLGF